MGKCTSIRFSNGALFRSYLSSRLNISSQSHILYNYSISDKDGILLRSEISVRAGSSYNSSRCRALVILSLGPLGLIWSERLALQEHYRWKHDKRE